MPKLTYVVGGGGETRSVDVGDSCSIGSLAGNTVVLDAALGISRRHCQVLKIQSGYEIADLGSTNGTKVNGAPVKKQKLKHGDKIEIGKVTMTFDDGSGAAPQDEEISLEEPAGEPAAGAPAARQGSASDQCVLVFAGGDKDGQKVPLDKQRVTFGRNPKNTVTLTDSGASGFHAEIAREGGAYVLRDLGSTNGTLVDGEPVSETALQHGARIRMGGTRFVFVDPTVSDFEKAMAAVDDLGSEWGLLRAEMDMTRVQEARRSQAILIGFILVVVLGGGAYVVTHPDVFSGSKQQIATVDGNKLSEDPSFELRQGSDWAARPDTPTKARGADSKSDGPAKQGAAFYAVTRDGAGGACAAAISSLASAVTVSPGKSVEFGAHVRCSGGAVAGTRVVWLDKPDATGREIGRNASPLVTTADWQPVKGVAMPPDGARAARLELINAAGGTAYFDDVFFLVGGGTAGGEQKSDGAISLSATGDGQISISRSDAKLLVHGAVVGGALRGDAVTDPARRGDRAGSQNITSGGLSVKGTLVDPTAFESQGFELAVSSTGGRYVEIKGKLPGAEAAWVAVLPDEFVTAGVGVRTDADFRRAGEPRLIDKVQDVSFGGQHRFRVQKGEGCGPLRMALYRVGDTWEVAFGAADGNLSLKIDTDSNALIADIETLRTEAAAAKQQRRFGVAISNFKRLEGFYPSGSAEAAAANQEWTVLDDKGRADLDRTQKRVAGAVQFSDESELRTADAEAATLAKEYAEHEVGTTAVASAAAIQEAVKKLQVLRAEREAAPLLRKADDFLAHKMTTLAKTFYGEVVQRFPGTEAAKKAGEKLAKL